MVGPAPSGSRREAGKARNRERLYDAALELFAAEGFDAVSVDDICARAGVGRATFFRLFGTKTGLLGEFDRRLATRARLGVLAAGEVEAGDQLRIVARSMCDSWAEGGAALRDLAQEYLQTVSVEVGTRNSQPHLRALVTEVVAEGQRREEFMPRPGAEFVSWMVVATLSGAVATWLDNVELLRRRAQEAIDLLLVGLESGVSPSDE